MPSTDDLVYAFAELCEARPGYIKAEAFYDGDYDEVYASDKVERMLAKFGLSDIDNLNFARLPVDAVANRLRITDVTVDDEAADEDLAELRRRNELSQEMPGLHRKACTCGDTYLMVWPETDDKGNVLGVDMFHNGPQTVRVIYDDENPLRKAYAIKSWTTGSGKEQMTRADLYYPDRIERWVYAGKWTAKKNAWAPYTEDGQDWELPNPYGEVPVFHFRTQRPYGLPEHYAAYGAQSAITKVTVSHLATIDFQSVPQRYALVDPAVDQSGVQSDWDPDHPEDDEADPQDPLNPSKLRNDPGELWMLQGLRQVGQFEAAQPDVFLKPLDRYIKAMAQLTETPMQIFDSTGDQVSGESRREANAPLTAKVEARQESFGATWEAAFEFALRILGHDGTTVTVRWKSAEVVGDAEGWQTVKAKIDAGVPREPALVEAGYDPEQVKGWMAELSDDAELGRRIALLASLGEAVQSLGAGVQMQAITPDQVQTLLTRVLAATTSLDQDAT